MTELPIASDAQKTRFSHYARGSVQSRHINPPSDTDSKPTKRPVQYELYQQFTWQEYGKDFEFGGLHLPGTKKGLSRADLPIDGESEAVILAKTRRPLHFPGQNPVCP